MAKPTPKPDKAPAYDSPITAAMLHEHIQATIFGRPSGDRGRHFDRLQNKLHELVDRGDDLAVVAAFVERIKEHAAGYLDTEGVSIFVASKELDVMRVVSQDWIEPKKPHRKVKPKR